MSATTKVTLALVAATALSATAATAGGWGDRGRGGPDRTAFFATFDADENGSVTLEEARSVQAERLARFDTDGNGELSLEAFAALHAEITRSRTVDAFQRLDADGDGAVTETEMQAPVQRLARLDRDGDSDIDRDDRTRR
jgi:Ca2+-binding EF-hand superfamily protein